MSKRKVPAKREEEHEVVTVSDSDDSQVQVNFHILINKGTVRQDFQSEQTSTIFLCLY